MHSKNKHNQNEPVSNLIHATARSKGWTLSDLAIHLGLSYIYLASLSNGARKISGLNIEKQRALAEFLGISMIEFFLLCGLLRNEDLVGK